MKKVPIRAAVFCMLLLSGCVFKTGKPLSADQARTLAPGATTKTELLERFGPPAAILARGEVAVVNAYAAKPMPMLNQYTYSFSADTFFELFPQETGQDRYRRIYYYRYIVSTRFMLPLLLWFQETGSTSMDQLWILMDERTETIEDYAFRKRGTNVLFGRSRQGRTVSQPGPAGQQGVSNSKRPAAPEQRNDQSAQEKEEKQ